MAYYPFTQKFQITWDFQGHLGDNYARSFPGVDYATWYGTDIRCPYDNGELVNYGFKDQNGTKYCSILFRDRNERWDFLHVSEVVGTDRVVNAGDIVAKAGNTGYVRPMPTPENPYLGTHTHVSIRRNYNFTTWRGEFVDAEPILNQLWQEQSQPAIKPLGDSQLQEANRRVEEMTLEINEASIKLQQASYDIANKEVEIKLLQDSINRLTDELSQYQVKLPNIQPLVVEIIEETVEIDGLLGRWSTFVDNSIKSKLLRSILKYDLFVYVGSLLSVVSLSVLLPHVDPSLLVVPSIILGIIVKLLVTRYDTNKDGKLDQNDFTVVDNGRRN